MILIINIFDQAHNDITVLKHEKNALKLSVRELQQRLTQAETSGQAPITQSTNIGTVEAAMKRSEREKDLEKQVNISIYFILFYF